jgi:hypothetical protein
MARARACGSALASQRAQVVRNVTELPDHGGVAKVAGGRISRPAEGDSADVTRLARERLGARHGGVGVESLDRLADGDAVVGRYEGQAT